MYTLAEKNKIIKLFKKGESISSIHLHSNISKSTLYRWKEQFEISKEKGKKVNELISQGKLQEAEELVKEILALDPNDLPARSQLISIYKQQGKIDEVERLAKELLALEPDALPARYTLITIYKQQGKIEGAEELAKEVLALDPNNLRVRSQLIAIYKQQGKTDEVEKLAKEILALDPNDLRARNQLIAIYKQQGKIEELERLPKSNDEQISKVNFSKQIQAFRKQIHNGTITVENLPQYEEELSTLPVLYQKVLLAEAYTKFNIPTKAIQLLKEARKS